MDHQDRIDSLKDKKTFESSNKSAQYTNTFLPPLSDSFMKAAHETKKEADEIYKINREEGHKNYIKSIFLYIKAFLNFEIEKPHDEVFNSWKSIDRYITGLAMDTNENEIRFKHTYEFILFNIKFHYLYYEGYYELKREGDGRAALKGFVELKGICERSAVERFCIVRLEFLEDFVCNQLAFIQ